MGFTSATFTIPAPAESDSAQKVISGLPKYIGGVKVEYTVTENVPDGFKQTDATTNVAINDATNEGEGSATNAPDSRDKLEGVLTITVKKVDGASESKTVLAGAEFTLTPPEGSASEPVVLVTGEDGTATFTLTEVGTYTLKETKAPEGYKLDGTEWKIETDRELESITKVTEGEGSEAQTFWQWLYNLIFKGGQSSDAFEFNAEEKSGTLTVENMPVENEEPGPKDDEKPGPKDDEQPKPQDDEKPGPKDDDGTQSDDKKGGQVNQDKTPTSSPKPSGTKTVASTGTPKTGDTANPALWLVLAFASLCVLLVSYGMRRFAYADMGAGVRTGAGTVASARMGAGVRAKHGKHAAPGKHARSRQQ